MDRESFYNSKAWKKVRETILRRDGYQCQWSKRYGKIVEGNTVHHIMPLEYFPEYRLKMWNLITVSIEVHKGVLHNRDGSLTREGLELLRRTVVKQGVNYDWAISKMKEPDNSKPQNSILHKQEITLVMGLPGSGKTTWAKEHLNGGVCYDLDYIVAALQLKEPKTGVDTAEAVAIVNKMLSWFAIEARIAKNVIVIRTAPTAEEIKIISPAKVILCKRNNQATSSTLQQKLIKRIADAEEKLKEEKIAIETWWIP